MLALLLFLSQAAAAQPEASWSSEETPHFVLHHESPGTPLGDENRVERIYEALHPALWPLVPWMTLEKVHLWLYSGRQSFLKGRFHPPGWSGGLMSDAGGEKALAVYEPLDTTIAAHELTHLYFHTYFDEKPAAPPSWLDEGLAGMLQDDALSLPDPRDKGPVIRSPIPMKTFLGSRPGQDTPGARVNDWYRQARSVVLFLRLGHVESRFVDFCAKLRDGSDSESALRDVYGYQDVPSFEAAWLAWRPKTAKGEVVGLETR